MKSTCIYYQLIVSLLIPIVRSSVTDFSRLHHDQERLKCIGIPCPSDKPKCIVVSGEAKCVIESADVKGNRLSRPPPGTPLSRPSSNEEPAFSRLPLSSGSNDNTFRSEANVQNQPQTGSSYASYSNVPQFCFEPPVSGRCRAYFQSYYFNPRSGICESFVYGGCDGNNNRFRYERDCKATCANPFSIASANNNNNNNNNFQNSAPTIASPTSPTEAPKTFACQLDADPGPCFAFIGRYHFNTNSRQCELFNYGGCQGNQNNFESLAMCQKSCSNFQPNVVSSSPINGQGSTFPLFSVPQSPQFGLLGTNFMSGASFPGSSLLGSLGTLESLLINNFSPNVGTQTQTSTTDKSSICLLPKKVGPCRASIGRYFFNKETQMCERFTYGGCRANENNFLSEQECVKSCGEANNNNVIRNRPLVTQISQMQPFPFWRDPRNDVAFREFLISSQLKANGNMMGASTNNYFVCTQPVNQGSCFEKIQSFFFNAQTGRCEPFVFRGCGGNRNRFNNIESCQQFCRIV